MASNSQENGWDPQHPHTRFLPTSSPKKRKSEKLKEIPVSSRLYPTPKSRGESVESPPKASTSRSLNLSNTTKSPNGSTLNHTMGTSSKLYSPKPSPSPGPGKYSLPSSIVDKKEERGYTATMGTSTRFVETRHLGSSPLLGPGSYPVPSSFSPKKRAKQTFFGTSPRFASPRDTNSRSPSPIKAKQTSTSPNQK